MRNSFKRICSVVCAAALLLTGVLPALESFAVSYTIGILDGDGNDVTGAVMTLAESKNTKCSVAFIDCSEPNGSEITWSSSNGLIASVDADGTVRARDSSRQALVQLWIDSDVKSIRGAGPSLGAQAEVVMQGLDVENSSAEELWTAFAPVFAELSQASQDMLHTKLIEKVENDAVTITATLIAHTGETLAQAETFVHVTKSTEVLSNTLPNGTYITNKDSLPSVVAVGTSFKIQNVITPVRLGMTTTWSLSTDSLVDLASNYADITEDGVITFKKAGTVTVTASPEFELFLSKLVDYVVNAGDEGADYVAAWLIDVLGIDVSQSTMSTALVYVVKLGLKLVGVSKYLSYVTTGNKVLKFLSNALMKAATNDKVTFTIVDELPLESFDISCSDTYQEGDREQLYITDLTPGGALVGDAAWSVSDPTAATVSEDGYLKILDAGGSSAQKTVSVTATLNGITVTKSFTLHASDGSASAIEVDGPSHIMPGETGQYTATVYPVRTAQAVDWGLKQENGTEVYAAQGQPVEDAYMRVESSGRVTGLALGMSTLVVRAANGLTEELPISIGTAVTGITLEEAPAITYSVPIYNTYNETVKQLHASVTPENVANPKIIWSLDDASNLTLSQDGKVHPVENKAAYGTVTAKTADGGYTASVQVAYANVPVTGVNLSEEAAILKAGKTLQLNATVTPDNKITGATIKNVSWKSTDPAVAVVDDNGMVYAVDRGDAQIICTTTDGGYTAVCAVTVVTDKDSLREMISLADTLDLSQIAAPQEDIDEFTAALAQAKRVEQDDTVYQLAVDTAFEALSDAYEKLCDIVEPESVTITIDDADAGDYYTKSVGLLDDYRDASVQLSCVISPDDALYRSVTWSSSNANVSVSQDGVVSPTVNSAQYSQITVTVTNHRGWEITDSIYVTFAYRPVTDLTFASETIYGYARETGKVEYTISPKGVAGVNAASIQDLQWETSDPEVVTVEDDGTLHFIAVGMATVTATTFDGGKTASCTVIVSLNRDALLAKIDEANAMDASLYTAESWQNMQSVLAQATAVYLSGDGTTQAEIDDATAALTAAIRALVTVRDAQAVTLLVNGAQIGDYYTVSVSGDYSAARLDLDYYLSPTDTTLGTVRFTSDNETVTVDQNGICAPAQNEACSAMITVTVTDYHGYQVADNVHITFAARPAASVAITPPEYTAGGVGEAAVTLAATVYDSSGQPASVQDVRWASENEQVLGITENGMLIYRDSGVCTVCVYTEDGNYTASATITVLGDKAELQAAIAAADAANITDSDYTYATYSVFAAAYETAAAVNVGLTYSQAEIDAAASALRSAQRNLEPLITIESLTITHDNTTAPKYNSVKVPLTSSYKNQSFSLGYIIQPANVEYQSVTWTSSDSGMTVNADGKVSPSKNSACAAKITLTVTDYYGREYSDWVYVSFANYPVTGVSLSQSNLQMHPGDTQSLSYEISPKGKLGVGDASIKTVIWESSDPQVATVENGVVTAVDSGTAEIYCIAVDGGVTATCAVAVTIDKSALNAAILEAASIKGAQYTSESFAALQTAISEARAVAEKTYAKTGEAQAAIAGLQDATAALQYRTADYTAVNAAVEAFNALLRGKYTAESYAAAQQAVDQVVYDRPVTAQAEVDAMAQAINDAIAQLVEKETARLVAADGSGVCVDEAGRWIFGVRPGTADVLQYLTATQGGSLTFTPSVNGSGTGSTVTLFDADGVQVDVFTVVIFGDVNGDSWYDGQDAVIVNCIARDLLTREQVGEAAYMAADCSRDGEIGVSDVRLLEQAGLLLANIDQTASQDELIQSDSYMEYIKLIEQDPNAEEPVGGSPQPKGITQIILDKIIEIAEYIIAFILSVIKL